MHACYARFVLILGVLRYYMYRDYLTHCQLSIISLTTISHLESQAHQSNLTLLRVYLLRRLAQST